MTILVFIFGLIIGSFFNVLVFRLDREKGILLGRSKCLKCKRALKWYDLVPVLSFLVLKTRCRYCKERISFIYPVVELATGIIFLLFFLKLGLPITIELWFSLILLLFLIPLIFFDYLYYIIPDKVIFPAIGLSLLFSFFVKRSEFIELLTSGLLLGGVFAILYIVSKGKWVGLGDAKLLFLIGMAFGYPLGFLIVTFSTWAATVLGLALIILKRASLKSEIPFGLFLSIVTIIFIIFQNETQTLKLFFY